MTQPPARGETDRAAIRGVIAGKSLDAREISGLIGIPERQVVEHLEHLAKGREKLKIEPARCRACEFSFGKRSRTSRPSRCPKCKSERIAAPRFSL
ncbi:MAG TPA: transcriptional regulator [Polyangiaceae bacterium]|nr:transcriptional regulator [Polyangiaceae bacterium]